VSMMPGAMPDYTSQARANLAALASAATAKLVGVTIQQPTPTVLAGLPAVVTSALASLPAAPHGQAYQVAKYLQIVNGQVTEIVDDGSPPTDPTLVHQVVTVITAGSPASTAVTHQVAARLAASK
jgi:hypothetical protein